MARMLEAVKNLYKGSDVINRQICLFSVCGILGLIFGYVTLISQNSVNMNIFLKILLCIPVCLISFYFVGYEILFLKKRVLPDFDLEPFKITLNKFILTIAIFTIILNALNIIAPKNAYLFFCIETILCIPFTMIQAGFSYNFEAADVFKLFKVFRVKDYFLLLLKRIWIAALSYITTSALVFVIFFIFGIILAIHYRGDISTLGLYLSSQQIIIAKFSNFIFAILLNYILILGTLSWDYELITTYESEEK